MQNFVNSFNYTICWDAQNGSFYCFKTNRFWQYDMFSLNNI